MPRKYSSKRKGYSGRYTKFRPVKKRRYTPVSSFASRTARSSRRYRSMNQRTEGLLGVEKKFLDTSITAVALVADTGWASGEYDPTATGCVGCLSAPATGDSASQRDGIKIVMTSIEVEGIWNVPALANQTGAPVPPQVYIALVLDTQTNAAQLNSEDVYGNLTASTITNVCPLRNMSFSERFKVLKKWKLTAPTLPLSYDGTNIEVEGYAIKFKCFKTFQIPVKFTTGSTTANVSGVIDNSLHIIANSTTTAHPSTLSYNSRMRFIG